jgi:hypothetical protein
MRFKEIINPLIEFVDQSSDPSKDLEYLILHTELSPEVRKFITNTVQDILSKEKSSAMPVQSTGTAISKNVQDPNTQSQPVPAPIVKQPARPEDQVVSEGSSEEDELLSYINDVKNKGELSRLLYVVRDKQFKDIASEIVEIKIKFKPKETYELIKGKIRALSSKVPVNVMTDFLNQCKAGGVLDASAMLKTIGVSNIPLVDPRFQVVAQAFLDLNLERLGKGEIGLAFMGINAVKEKSDISIDNLQIEVKASKGTDFFMKGNPDEGGFGNQSEAVAYLTDQLNRAGGKFKKTNLAKQGGIAVIGRANISALNQYFAVMGRAKVIDVLVNVLKILNKGAPELVDNYIEDISKSVLPDGSIHYNVLSMTTAKINFDYYKTMSQHNGVLLLDLTAFQYAYTDNAKSFVDLISKGILHQMYAVDFRSNGLGGIAYMMGK